MTEVNSTDRWIAHVAFGTSPVVEVFFVTFDDLEEALEDEDTDDIVNIVITPNPHFDEDAALVANSDILSDETINAMVKDAIADEINIVASEIELTDRLYTDLNIPGTIHLDRILDSLSEMLGLKLGTAAEMEAAMSEEAEGVLDPQELDTEPRVQNLIVKVRVALLSNEDDVEDEEDVDWENDDLTEQQVYSKVLEHVQETYESFDEDTVPQPLVNPEEIERTTNLDRLGFDEQEIQNMLDAIAEELGLDEADDLADYKDITLADVVLDLTDRLMEEGRFIETDEDDAEADEEETIADDAASDDLDD